MSDKPNARILIADDQEGTRKALRALIASHPGWEVCGEAENGSQAIVMAKALRPDLIVLDLSMPVKDGLQAAHEISKVRPDVPLLIYTFYVSAELAAAAKEAGVRRVVDKAGTNGKLVTEMRMLLAAYGLGVIDQGKRERSAVRPANAG